MKDKIERFSRGDFEYGLPYLYLSEEELRITVEAGKVYEGGFTISNSVEREMKGYIYSSNQLMQIGSPSFYGASNQINYTFHGEKLRAGEVIQGQLSIVSDCGERLLPFIIEVEAAYINTSLGKIKDLFQFTNLAKVDWAEAKKVFRMEEFERVFLLKEDRYRFIYRNLIKGITTSQALEEFLIAIHKKAMLHLTVDRTRVEYVVTEEGRSDRLLLSRDHWGYAEIRITTESPFIQLEQKFLWADRFIENSHPISYSIDPAKLRPGINYGQILIKTAYQTLTVDVKCSCKMPREKHSEYRRIQRLELGLINNYLRFRLNRIDLQSYILEAEGLWRELPDREDSRRKGLIRAHLALVSGNEGLVKEELDSFKREEALWKRRSVVEYCAYLYLNALYTKEEEVIREAVRIIRSYYENGRSDWRILWFLLNLDATYGKGGGRKLSDIREQYEAGCRSPILYYEGICILNQEPVLLRELNEFEIQLMNYGLKNWTLTRELALQYTYLANKRKTYHPLIYRGLVRLYDEYGEAEILSAICCLLIKGLKRSEKYFEWYRLGVEAQLRITELYEYYMYSVSYSVEEPLAQPVLLYFIYNSSISDRRKAFLYANIVKNRDKNEPIYRSYLKRMELFTAKMLEAHQISLDLAVLYREFLTKSPMVAELSKHLPFVIFRQELICGNPNIISVRVVHRELGLEEKQTLNKGSTQIDIFTGNAEVFLIDSSGNCYLESVDYRLIPYLNPEDFEKHCLEYMEHYKLQLHLFDRYQRYRIMSEDSIRLRKQVLELERLEKEALTDCYRSLIDYYYENNEDEQLEYYLSQIELTLIKPAERTKYMDYMIVRRIYRLVLPALEEFGFEGLEVNHLVKLCSGWMLIPDAMGRSEIMTALCYYVFSQGKYDEAILRYLVQHYEGATEEMLHLWRAAKGFELDTHILEERLLTQLLFTQGYQEDSYLVFKEYYQAVSNHVLIRAYLSFYAYQYLVHEQVIPSELFLIMRRELNYDENDICLIAWLKYNVYHKELTDNDRCYIERCIAGLVKKGIILPFFADYGGWIALPERVMNHCYITYIADPRNQVYLHFRFLGQQEDYITERMVNAFLGIHVKELVLFYHETIQYYITERCSEEETITESFHAQYEPEPQEDEDSKYNQINLMLRAVEREDDSTLQDIMEKYIQREYLANACFTRIE